MKLLMEYHKSKDFKRRKEFLRCLQENAENELIDKIFVFASDKFPLKSKKFEVIPCKERPTFWTLFKFCNKVLEDQICIIACADIIFDDTLKHLEKMGNTFVALTRWEGKNPNGNPACQDVWAFKAPLNIADEWFDQMNFTAGGYWGCDNKIAYLMDKAGYELRNPGLQIKALHVHSSEYRSASKRLLGPFLCLVPNDDIEKKTEYIRINDFNSLGQAI